MRTEGMSYKDSLPSFRPKCISTEWRNLYDRVGTIHYYVKYVVEQYYCCYYATTHKWGMVRKSTYPFFEISRLRSK